MKQLKQTKLLSIILAFAIIVGVAPSTIATAPAGETRELYNMLTDPNFADLTSSVAHPLFRRVGEPFSSTPTPRTVTVGGRTGTSQGLRLWVDALSPKANHTYTLSYSGRFTNEAGAPVAATARLRRETGPQLAFTTAPAAADGTFTLTHTMSAADITAGAGSFIALGCASSAPFPDITYTALSLTETCPAGCNLGCGQAPTTVAIYDMQLDPRLFLFDSSGTNANGTNDSTHPLLRSNGGIRRANMGWARTGHSLEIRTRGGSSQGVDINLSALPLVENHSYRFEFTGRTLSGDAGASNNEVTFTAATGQGGSDTMTTNLTRVVTTLNTPFTLRHELTTAAIQAHITAGRPLFRLGGVFQRDLEITGIVITSLCPPACNNRACVTMPPLPTAVDRTPFTTAIPSSTTARSVVDRISVGWNLGNTFDSHTDGSAMGYGLNASVMQLETAWIGGAEFATTRTLIQSIRRQGFNTIRIPVTWYKAFDPAAPAGSQIRADYMARVRQVVDWAMAEGMIVILNTHHENGVISLTGNSASGSDPGRTYLSSVWTQIANTFRDYNERLIFEGLNEPRNIGSADQWRGGSSLERTNLGHLNQRFVEVVRGTAGNNTNRILMIPTMGASAHADALSGFSLPTDPSGGTSRLAMSIHVYAPHDWAHEGNGSYGGPSSGSSNSSINASLDRVRSRANALGVPAVLGEFGSISTAGSSSTRAQHARDYIAAATSRGMRAVWWDTGTRPGRSAADGGDSFAIMNRSFPHAARHQNIISSMMAALCSGNGPCALHICPTCNRTCTNPACQICNPAPVCGQNNYFCGSCVFCAVPQVCGVSGFVCGTCTTCRPVQTCGVNGYVCGICTTCNPPNVCGQNGFTCGTCASCAIVNICGANGFVCGDCSACSPVNVCGANGFTCGVCVLCNPILPSAPVTRESVMELCPTCNTQKRYNVTTHRVDGVVVAQRRVATKRDAQGNLREPCAGSMRMSP